MKRIALVLAICVGLALVLPDRTVIAGGNLGTVTAGSISGITATFGSGGEVTLDSSGMTLVAGSSYGTRNQVKWNDGSFVYSVSDDITVSGDNAVVLDSNGYSLYWSHAGGGLYAASGHTLGTSSLPWQSLDLADLAGSGTNRFACHDNSGKLSDDRLRCCLFDVVPEEYDGLHDSFF
jgi:hypothetical protein